MEERPRAQIHNHPPVCLAISFDLEQYGWASLTILADNATFEIGSFGYCTDALGDIVKSAGMIARGAPMAQFILDGEPVLWGCVIRDGWQSVRFPAVLRLLVKSDEQRVGHSSATVPVSDWPHLEFETFVTADAYAQAVSRAAHCVLDEYGEQGYLERWVHYSFPSEALADLDAALASPYEDRHGI